MTQTQTTHVTREQVSAKQKRNGASEAEGSTYKAQARESRPQQLSVGNKLMLRNFVASNEPGSRVNMSQCLKTLTRVVLARTCNDTTAHRNTTLLHYNKRAHHPWVGSALARPIKETSVYRSQTLRLNHR